MPGIGAPHLGLSQCTSRGLSLEQRQPCNSHTPPLSSNALNSVLQLLHIPAHNPLIEGFTILKQDEGRHSADLQFLSDRADLIDVDLQELDVCVGLAELADDGGDGLAGAAPGGEEVDDDGAGGSQGFEDDGVVDFDYFAV